MDRQEMFDKAVAGIRAQGALARSEYGLCFYITPAGHRCAIGQLISKQLAETVENERLFGEDTSVLTLSSIPEAVEAFAAEGIDIEDEFIQALQQYHDVSFNLEDFEKDLSFFARAWGLEYNEN